MMNRRYIKAIRTAALGILATVALIWGAVDIVGVSIDALANYLWLSTQGVALLIVLALPCAWGLRFLRRRR